MKINNKKAEKPDLLYWAFNYERKKWRVNRINKTIYYLCVPTYKWRDEYYSAQFTALFIISSN